MKKIILIFILVLILWFLCFNHKEEKSQNSDLSIMVDQIQQDVSWIRGYLENR